MNRTQCDEVLALFARDREDGLFHRMALGTAAITKYSIEVTGRWTAKFGVRSLDVMHVCAAVAIGANRFLTGDGRQRRLARAAGLTT
ncbi:MAG: hypothetical protein ACREM2_04360 [Vulcanimicrobiaceae bacterium]